ncbi:MAG: hypothetical protein J5850_04650, partial [Clostridia bacterium]|nr:hypothetical protein [Clostridia bacterium]
PSKAAELKEQFGKAITVIPGKTENWLMVNIEDKKTMFFSGDGAPCAIAEVKLFGKAADRDLDNLTAVLCRAIGSSLGVSEKRIYVKYEFVDHWGWNGSNF